MGWVRTRVTTLTTLSREERLLLSTPSAALVVALAPQAANFRLHPITTLNITTLTVNNNNNIRTLPFLTAQPLEVLRPSEGLSLCAEAAQVEAEADPRAIVRI